MLLLGCSNGEGNGGSEQTSSSLALSAEELPVLVASERIPAGTDAAAALADGRLREDTVTRAQFPENAIVSAELIEDKVAAETLLPGTIILAGMFVDPTAPTT
jgi:flagella basal body P-ring formation protein FlgA